MLRLRFGRTLSETIQQKLFVKQKFSTNIANHFAKVQVNGFQVNFEKVGTGSHGILCLPGALGSINTDFQPQLEHLNRENLTVVIWDPPGYGLSRPPDRNFTGGSQMFFRDANTAQSLMKAVGFEKFSLLGWSDGGITSLIIAALFPKEVRKLIVWGANAFISKNDIELYAKVSDIDGWSPKMKAPMLKLYGEDYFRQSWTNCIKCYNEIYKNGGDICKNLLPNIVCPTLIIHGRKDSMVGIEHPQYLHQYIPNSKLVIMEDGKHNLHLRYFKEFNSMVENFLLENNNKLN